MGRNDLCFCGSGKKTKKCHGEINPNSLVANCLMAYSEVDKHISNEICENSYSFTCSKGCSKCCSDYFFISEVEYFTILNYLISNPSDFNLFQIQDIANQAILHLQRNNKKAFDLIDEYMPDGDNFFTRQRFFDDNASEYKYPCIFLKDNLCSIYPVRPFVCRTFGYSSFYGRCAINEYKDEVKLPINLIFAMQTNIDDLSSSKTALKIKRRPYPMAYLFSHFLKNHLSLNDWKYIYSTQRSVDDFIDKILQLHKSRNL